LTPELLAKMTGDLRQKANSEVDPQLQGQMEALLNRMENYQGVGGKEILKDYQEMKFGNKGYYREETDFLQGESDQQTTSSLESMKAATEKKKELTEKLEKNIEELKSSKDEGLLSVNKALKDELETVDSTSSDEKTAMTKELDNTKEALDELAARAKDPDLQKKINDLTRENQKLAGEITPHMRAEGKSEMANNILQEKKALEEIRNEVRQKIEEELKKEEPKPEDTPDKKRDYSGLIRIVVLVLGGMLFFWFMSRFKKKGIKRVRGISEELKEDIEEKLREVKKKKLSPRDEVIETYNVLHDGLKGMVFTGETPPSCIVYEGMSSVEPELTLPLFTVTETFATTFYGDHDVTTPALKAFRKDVTKVFSFFDIRT
jgi:hypothetical protein